jgi:predicted aspartyl protease
VPTGLGVLCCGLLLLGQDSLWQLAQSRRLFELRQAAQEQDLFYQGIVAARFGHEEAGIEQLRRFLQTNPDPEKERRAHEELAAALVRTGHFGDAVSEYREVLRVTLAGYPDRREIEDKLFTCEALRDVPPQSVEFGNEAPVKTQFAGFFSIPLRVNGKPTQWAIDTGAELSVVTETEAKKLGLSIQKGLIYANGSTGKRNPVRTAVARDLELGGARFRNVAFVVIPDKGLPRGAPHGFIGLPVLRGLGRVSISAKVGLQFQPHAPIPSGEPNLFFEQLTPIVELKHGGRSLQMAVDSGANQTSLYSSFLTAFSAAEASSIRKKKVGSTGLGETITQIAETIPSLTIELPGREVILTNVPFRDHRPADLQFEDGVIGLDVLSAGFAIDFRSMQLVLDAPLP